MNATEARKLAENNADKVANRQLEEAITRMEDEITERALDGYMEARIETRGFDRNSADKFRRHFESKGFEVAVISLNEIKHLSCRW